MYILVGTVAREHTGPALAVSFFIAGVAAALSACCYAELASRCPSAGSAYHYAYICLGEGYIYMDFNRIDLVVRLKADTHGFSYFIGLLGWLVGHWCWIIQLVDQPLPVA